MIYLDNYLLYPIVKLELYANALNSHGLSGLLLIISIAILEFDDMNTNSIVYLNA
mgnify:CR=1 FL=1